MIAFVINIAMIQFLHQLPSTLPKAEIKPLTIDTERKIRSIVYEKAIGVATPREGKYALRTIVVIPEAIQAAYDANPKGVIDLLLVIAEGARPEDSIKAIMYAKSLIKSPTHAVGLDALVKKEQYDDDAKGITIRRYLVADIQRDMKTPK